MSAVAEAMKNGVTPFVLNFPIPPFPLVSRAIRRDSDAELGQPRAQAGDTDATCSRLLVRPQRFEIETRSDRIPLERVERRRLGRNIGEPARDGPLRFGAGDTE